MGIYPHFFSIFLFLSFLCLLDIKRGQSQKLGLFPWPNTQTFLHFASHSPSLLLLLLLSCFSHVRLCAAPQMAAHQAPLSLGFSRQEHWSGLPFPSPVHKSESESAVAQSCPTLSEPMDCSLPGSSIHGIFQARVLEWGVIAFSASSLYIPLIYQVREKEAAPSLPVFTSIFKFRPRKISSNTHTLIPEMY